jgi:UPF0042 nucleotide-binding protein
MGQTVLVIGMSGAGRTTALKALEDLGFETVDNPPADLLDQLLATDQASEGRHAAGVGCRSRAFDPARLGDQLAKRRPSDRCPVHLLFLDCEEEILRRRFSETKRPHPLAADGAVSEGIALERQLLAPVRAHADLVIDTSQLSPAELRRLIGGHFAGEEAALTLSILSFGYRDGLPREADLVFDVRFLANPHYVDALRPGTGRDAAVRAHVVADPAYAPLMQRLDALLTPLLPAYRREGRSYLTIAFGCTGGRHRSVVVAEDFAGRLRAAGWSVLLRHRDTPEANQDAG